MLYCICPLFCSNPPNKTTSILLVCSLFVCSFVCVSILTNNVYLLLFIIIMILLLLLLLLCANWMTVWLFDFSLLLLVPCCSSLSIPLHKKKPQVFVILKIVSRFAMCLLQALNSPFANAFATRHYCHRATLDWLFLLWTAENDVYLLFNTEKLKVMKLKATVVHCK